MQLGGNSELRLFWAKQRERSNADSLLCVIFVTVSAMMFWMALDIAENTLSSPCWLGE